MYFRTYHCSNLLPLFRFHAVWWGKWLRLVHTRIRLNRSHINLLIRHIRIETLSARQTAMKGRLEAVGVMGHCWGSRQAIWYSISLKMISFVSVILKDLLYVRAPTPRGCSTDTGVISRCDLSPMVIDKLRIYSISLEIRTRGVQYKTTVWNAS